MRKKFILLTIISPLSALLAVSTFYYFFFFQPMESNKELFPLVSKPALNNKNPEEADQNKTLPSGKKAVPGQLEEKYGITLSEVKKISETKKVYFIDGREPEEFKYNHFEGAKHIRTLDIKSPEVIKRAFDLSDEEFKNSFFVIYCHDGTRAADLVSELKLDNVKFLIGGVVGSPGQNKGSQLESIREELESVFREEIKNYDFTIPIDEALNFLKQKDNLLIDGRLYQVNVIPSALSFRIGALSTEEYEKKLQYILNFKDKGIIYIADIYADLFYAKLLIQRLEENYGFSKKNFHILFKQTDILLKNLNKAELGL